MRLLLLALALAADPLDSGDSGAAYDEDGDRFSVADGDCNDHDDRVYPGHVEDCDGLDNDCNVQVDEGCPEPPEGEGCECGSGDAGLALPGLLLPGLWLSRRRSSSAARRSGTSPS